MPAKTQSFVLAAILCVSFLALTSEAQGVFNTPTEEPFSSSNLYGAPTPVHSPEYYNNLITTQSNQQYDALKAANQAKQNDPQLKALQEKMLNSTNEPQSSLTSAPAQTPQASTPTQPRTVHQATPPANVIYQTPVNTKNSNDTATNLKSSDSNSNSSNSGSLDIQY